jgi:hypothetical protein
MEERSMKKTNIIRTLLVCILLGVIGCQNDLPPTVQDNPVATQGPEFIKLPRIHSLARIVSDTALITPQGGGRLELNFQAAYLDSAGVTRNLDVRMSVTFPSNAVTDTLVATMSLDDQVLRSTIDLTFGPHGSTFLRPALLDVDVRGIDLSGLRPQDKVYLWYKDNGTWIRMDAQSIQVDVQQGRIRCNNGELPHFSAYAFGR